MKQIEYTDDSFYIDFKDGQDFNRKMIDVFNDIAKKEAHYVDRAFLTGLSLLSKRKKKRIRKWIFEALKKKKKGDF